MFSEASSFNQPLNDWNVSNVQNMFCMFNEAKSFNQPLDKWDISNVKDMAYMFCEATSFRQPITAWRLCGRSTKGMFLRLPDYCDMESRVMCLTPLNEEAMKYDLEDMIKISERRQLKMYCSFTVRNMVLRNIRNNLPQSRKSKRIILFTLSESV